MTRKWNIALTYEPKIEAVKTGTCVQTIRLVGKSGPKQVGDLISFHGWADRPYHSSWSWRMPYKEITVAENILISLNGWGKEIADAVEWNHPLTDLMARFDGIVPPTGEALRDVLILKNGNIPICGVAAQIIRWKP